MIEVGGTTASGSEVARRSVDSPLGPLTVTARDGDVIGLEWVWADPIGTDPVLDRALDELRAYFERALDTFTVPIAPAGSPFQAQVWSALRRIPRGSVLTYGAMAEAVGGSARSVGTACGANPIPIIVPCHRVVAAAGRAGGFSGQGGLTTKSWLLAHEGAQFL